MTLVIKFIPKFLGLRFSKQTMGWQWRDMFPLKHLILFVTICIVLSFFCKLCESYFKSDIHWFLVCGSTFGILYLASSNLIGTRGRYAHV